VAAALLGVVVCRQQDAHLEDIEAAVTRLGRVGLTIHEELASQGQMLDELEEDVDTTHSRLRATQKKVWQVPEYVLASAGPGSMAALFVGC
jgi:hypothetical protein